MTLCIQCGNENDTGDKVCLKCQLKSSKERELVLLKALGKMDRERMHMYENLFQINRCNDCARFKSCLERPNNSTMRAKQEDGSYCALWEYKGRMTPRDELVIQAREEARREELNWNGSTVTES